MYNWNFKFNYKFIVIPIIIFFIIYLAILIYNNNQTKYNNDYIKCIATITDKKIESEDYIINKNYNHFVHKKNFRIKIKYEYEIDDKKYTGYFYNDGKCDKYLPEDKYIPIGNTCKFLNKINVYYNKNNYYESYFNLDKKKYKNKKVYFILITFCIFILFITFFI